MSCYAQTAKLKANRLLGDVILSVPPFMASPSLATAPSGSASLSAQQYMLSFSGGSAPPAGKNTSISVNPSQVSVIITYAGPGPAINCVPCGQPNPVAFGSQLSPQGIPSPVILNPGAVAASAALNCCFNYPAPYQYT